MMSELTSCNFCNVQDLKRRYGKDLKLQKSRDGWIDATVKGKFKASFMKVTKECAC